MSMCKKQNPAPEAQVCGWTWPLTSVGVPRICRLGRIKQVFFLQDKADSKLELVRMQIHPNKKKIDPLPSRKRNKIHRLFDPRAPWPYVSHTLVPLSTSIQISRRRSETGVILNATLWEESCISGWSGRLHPTAANGTQVDELPASYICLPANLLFTPFLLPCQSSSFFPPSISLLFQLHIGIPLSLSFFCLWTSRLQCKESHHGQ